MTKKNVLIITHTADNEGIDKVMNFLREAGAEVSRFDVDRYPLSLSLTTLFTDNTWKVLLHDGVSSWDLQTVTAVWNRRIYNLGAGLSKVIDHEFVPGAIGEIKRTLLGMMEGLSCFHMERTSTYRRLDSKEEQLKKAMRYGLLIPSTCISNDPAEISQFYERTGSVIAKMQNSFAIYRGQEEHVVFTNTLTDDHLEDLDSVQYCPMVFQEKIEKKLELRVTIVGNSLFAFSIDSQKMDNASTDWRKEGVALLEDWQPYELPSSIKEKLLAFMDDYGLNYGAVDLILTPDDQYYFLEVNAAGEYYWLDQLCENAISKQIAAVLLGDAPRRKG